MCYHDPALLRRCVNACYQQFHAPGIISIKNSVQKCFLFNCLQSWAQTTDLMLLLLEQVIVAC